LNPASKIAGPRAGAIEERANWSGSTCLLHTSNRMYAVITNGIRLGRREHGAHRPGGVTSEECEEAYRNGPMVIEHRRRGHERRRLCLGETNRGRLLDVRGYGAEGQETLYHGVPNAPKQREIYRGEEE